MAAARKKPRKEPTRSGSATTTRATLKRLGLPTHRAPTTPGEVLEEEFRKPLRLTQEALAKRLGTTVQTVNRIVRGRQAVTASMALRLAEVLKTTPRMWLSLQADVDLWRAVTGRDS